MKKYKMNKEIKKVFDKMDPDVQASIKVLKSNVGRIFYCQQTIQPIMFLKEMMDTVEHNQTRLNCWVFSPGKKEPLAVY